MDLSREDDLIEMGSTTPQFRSQVVVAAAILLVGLWLLWYVLDEKAATQPEDWNGSSRHEVKASRGRGRFEWKQTELLTAERHLMK